MALISEKETAVVSHIHIHILSLHPPPALPKESDSMFAEKHTGRKVDSTSEYFGTVALRGPGNHLGNRGNNANNSQLVGCP